MTSDSKVEGWDFPVKTKRSRLISCLNWLFVLFLWPSQENNALQIANQSTCYISYKNKPYNNEHYYMENSVLLGTKPLVDSIRHFIQDPSGVFSICHLCECSIIQWSHDSCLLLLLNWFLDIIKRTLHVGSKIWILCSRGRNNISLMRYCSCHSNMEFIPSRHRVISSIYY